MILISNPEGQVLKSIPFRPGKRVGYSPIYGFVSEESFLERRNNRIRHGFKDEQTKLDFSWELSGDSENNFKLENLENCKVEKVQTDSSLPIQWALQGKDLTIHLSPLKELKKLPLTNEFGLRDSGALVATLSVTMIIALVMAAVPKKSALEDQPVVIEQVTVKIKQEVQKPVDMTTALDKIPEIKKQADITKRAIHQKLGFLGLLGRKDLKLAVGGAPTELKDASPGAGPGGKEGSGGELLVGLGQGLKRTTVGNSGVAGLGGVGTKGAGGGAGGYGTSSIGSGEGRALSSVAMSNELVLEGGLDRSVVQATIAKYLSQVRACYETGLKRNPGLGGQVTMAFEIGGEGDLNYSRVQRSSLDDREVEQCISQKMMSWKFPKPRGGVNVKVSYPFVLRATQS